MLNESRTYLYFSVFIPDLHEWNYANGFHRFCTDFLQMATDRDPDKIGTSRILNGFRTYFHRRLGKIWGQCGEMVLVGKADITLL